MARSRLPNPAVDLIKDGGAVLFSFIDGEQIEYPIDLNFLHSPSGHTIVVSVVEARNIPLQTEKPISAEPGGVRTDLSLRIPKFRGAFSPITAYSVGDMVSYNGLCYIRALSPLMVDPLTPDLNPYWVESPRSRIYIQFPSTLCDNWKVRPQVGYAVYGFIEVSVTENEGQFPRTWKPVRGMVELLFSPTK